MKKTAYIFLAALLTGIGSLKAQTNIGSRTDPDASAQLQISSSTKGVMMPKVPLIATTTFTLTGDTKTAGMVVYNTNAAITGTTMYPAYGAGLYAWDGTGWKGTPVVSATPTFPQTVLVAYGDTVGTGSTLQNYVHFARPMNLSHVSFSNNGSVTLSNNTITINATGTYKFDVALDCTGSSDKTGTYPNRYNTFITLADPAKNDNYNQFLPPNYSTAALAWAYGASSFNPNANAFGYKSIFPRLLFTGYLTAGTQLVINGQTLSSDPNYVASYRIASLEIQRLN